MFIKKIEKKIEKQMKKNKVMNEIRTNESIVRWRAKQYVDCKYSAIAEEHAKCSDIEVAIAALNLKIKLAKLEYDLI